MATSCVNVRLQHKMSTTTVALGSSDPANQPRNTYRYDMQLLGSNDPNASILSSRPPSGTVKENVLP